MKKKRWSNKPWNPSLGMLWVIHKMKKQGRSYRQISKIIGKDHVTIRRYYLKWLEARLERGLVLRFFDWLKNFYFKFGLEQKMNIKRIIIDGKPEELEFIVRIMCGVMMIAQLSHYKNIKNEGLIFLEANRK